jgi:cytochrome bd ubiquinol oxidase subunit II
MTVAGFALDLPFIWAVIIAFAVLAYVVMDGFDLGIGILFGVTRSSDHRDQMMTSIAPVWDGNETWLILGGGGLFAAFPLAYATLLPALYVPLTAMLLGLVFRGVAFEFRWRTVRGRDAWDFAFFAGSAIAAFAQGVALGAFIQGIKVTGRAYAGGWYDWATPFSLLTGIAVVIGYTLLGATWLVMKTEGELRDENRIRAVWLGLLTLASIGLVSLWTPFLDPVFMKRWFSFPAVLYVVPVPVLVGLCAWRLWVALTNRHDTEPFLMATSLFVLSFIGLGISIFPHVVPPGITIWQAAAPKESLSFLLVGVAILLPMILTYTALSYWVFRGKIDQDTGHH